MRYLRLYLYFLRFSISRALEFRLDFVFRVAMDAVYYAVNLTFFTVLYAQTPLLAGWNLDQIYLFVCAFLLADALFMAVFSNNLWWIPQLVNRGDLDYYLVRPVSTLFFVSLRDFAVSSFLNVVMAAGLVVWALWRYPEPLGVGQVAAYLLLIVVGTLLTYLMRLMFLLPVFWTHSGHGLLQISWSLAQLGERPVKIYSPWLRWLQLTLIPVGFVASVPSEALFEGLSPRLALHTLLVTVGLFALVVALWRRGLESYASASS